MLLPQVAQIKEQSPVFTKKKQKELTRSLKNRSLQKEPTEETTLAHRIKERVCCLTETSHSVTIAFTLLPVEPILRNPFFSVEDEIVVSVAAARENESAVVCGRVAQVLQRPKIVSTAHSSSQTPLQVSNEDPDQLGGAMLEDDRGRPGRLCDAPSSMIIGTRYGLKHWNDLLLYRFPNDGLKIQSLEKIKPLSVIHK